MAYERINWLNKVETDAKPINKTNLNIMDEGIYNLQNELQNEINVNHVRYYL